MNNILIKSTKELNNQKKFILTQEELSIIRDALDEIFIEGDMLYDTDGGLETYDWDMENIKGDLFNGATKIVFCPDGANYVIKAPITGTITYNNNDEETSVGSYINYYSKCHDKSYCIDEYNLYIEAKKRGIEDFFAYIEEINSPIDERVFLQEKVNSSPFLQSTTLNTLEKSTAENQIEQTILDFIQKNQIVDLYNALEHDADILFTLYDTYSLKQLQKLNQFIKDYNINDLTYNNMGARNDNTICFFDYSGYYE